MDCSILWIGFAGGHKTDFFVSEMKRVASQWFMTFSLFWAPDIERMSIKLPKQIWPKAHHATILTQAHQKKTIIEVWSVVTACWPEETIVKTQKRD